MQSADKIPTPFSYMNDKIDIPQIDCGITRTNINTHNIIAKNINLSPVYSGSMRVLGQDIVQVKTKLTGLKKRSLRFSLNPKAR